MAVLDLPTHARTMVAAGETTADTDDTQADMRLMVTDRYRILRPLGQGGMGIVYEAYDRLLRRRVALKLIRRDNDKAVAAAARLVREARVMAALEHDHVVSAYDVGTWEGRVFIAMQLIEGMTLRHWMQAEKRTDAEKLRVLIGAGRGLAAAHASHIVHRDFKPDNVLVDVKGVARVTDFGIARQLDRTEPEVAPSIDPLGDTQLTQSGALLGTPHYMAPEQAMGASVTGRADQFSFCVTAWELFAGHRPFAGDTVTEVLANKMAGELVPTSTDRWPSGLVQVLRRGFAVDPNARYSSMDALLAELDTIATSTPMRRRGRVLRAASMIAAAASAGAIAIVLVGSTSGSTHPAAAAATGASHPTVEPIVTPGPGLTVEEITPAAPALAAVAAAAQPEPRAAEPARPSHGSSRRNRSKASTPAEPARAEVAEASAAPSVAEPEHTAAPAVAAPPAPPAAEAKPATDVVERELAAIEADRSKRELLDADMPGYAATRDLVAAAIRRGEVDVATQLEAKLRSKLDAVRVDAKFVEAKVALLNERAGAVRLDDAQSKTLHSRLSAAITAWGNDQPIVANRHLTAVAKLLGMR